MIYGNSSIKNTQVSLTLPDIRLRESYFQYIAELGAEERYPFQLDFEHQDFDAMLSRLEEFRQGRNLPEGFVATSTFWLTDGRTLLGVSSLRHSLNDRIRHCGGHIGLSIRPSARGQGLGKKLLGLTIARARERGIQELHIHCHKHNVASARMIIHQGGDLHSEITLPNDDNVIQRYLLG